MSKFFEKMTEAEAEKSIAVAKEIVARVDDAIESANFSELRKLAKEGYVSKNETYDAAGMVSSATYEVNDMYHLCLRDSKMSATELMNDFNNTVENLH